MWKMENIPNEFNNLAKVISQQGNESVTWLLFAASDKMQEEEVS